MKDFIPSTKFEYGKFAPLKCGVTKGRLLVSLPTNCMETDSNSEENESCNVRLNNLHIAFAKNNIK